jgi:hypothetical protein
MPGASSNCWRLGSGLCFWVVSLFLTSCTVYDSSLLAASEDVPRDSEHSGALPDGGSGQSLVLTGGGSGEHDSGNAPAAEDSNGAVQVTVDDATVDPGDDSTMRTERGMDAGTSVDARPPSVGEEIIDDMEDVDQEIRPVSGRRGDWFTLNDGTTGAVQTPVGPFLMSAIPNGRGASMYAARTTGHGFKVWAPLFGFWMNKLPAGLKQTYDARKYAGITFWVRSGSETPLAVRMMVPNADTDPDGKTCVDAGGGCSDHFGKNFVATSQWTKLVVRFADLAQAGWGHKVERFDASSVYGVEWQFGVGAEFDCWVDDVSFLVE